MQKDMLTHVKKDRVWKRESRNKALSPRTATVEMEIQRKSELVKTSCKNNEISQNGLGTQCMFVVQAISSRVPKCDVTKNYGI